MNQTNQPPAVQSKARLSADIIQNAPSVKAMMDIPAIGDNWVNTYNKISRRKDGELRWNAEKVMFMQLVSNNKAFDQVDKFSIYTAVMELAISGLSLRDGIAYVIPKGKKAVFMPGWRGRLEQINEIETVSHCHEPQVVYSCDDFDYEKGEKVRINRHKTGTRDGSEKITHVYFVIDFVTGPVIYIMDAIDVLNIRNLRSDSFKFYKKLCDNAGKQLGETWKIDKGSYQVDVELPMWITDEAQAFKKTIVKRTWGTLPKLPKYKWLDEKGTAAYAGGADAEEIKETVQFEQLLALDESAAVTVTPEAKEPPVEQKINERNAISDADVIVEKTPDISMEVSSLIGNPEESF